MADKWRMQLGSRIKVATSRHVTVKIEYWVVFAASPLHELLCGGFNTNKRAKLYQQNTPSLTPFIFPNGKVICMNLILKRFHIVSFLTINPQKPAVLASRYYIEVQNELFLDTGYLQIFMHWTLLFSQKNISNSSVQLQNPFETTMDTCLYLNWGSWHYLEHLRFN